MEQLESALADRFRQGGVVCAPTPPGSAGALLTLAGQAALQANVVWVANGAESLETTHRDIVTLAGCTGFAGAGRPEVLYYPAQEVFQGRTVTGDPDVTGHRLNTLSWLSTDPGRQTGAAACCTAIIVTCVQALMQKTVSPAELRRRSFTLAVDGEQDLEDVTSRLTATGFTFTPEVQEKGQAAVRGGLLDLWPLTEAWPFRIEFNGPVVESIRSFNPLDQKSVERHPSVAVPPAGERAGPGPSRGSNTTGFLAHLPDDTVFVWSDLEDIREHAAANEDLASEAGVQAGILSFRALRAGIGRKPRARQWEFGVASEPLPAPACTVFAPVPGLCRLPREALQPDALEQARNKLVADLAARALRGQEVIVFFDTQGALQHFRESVLSQTLDNAARVKRTLRMEIGSLSEGFVNEALGLVVVADSDLYGRRRSLDRRYDPDLGRTKPERMAGARLTDLNDMEPGDLVVHTEHGVGRYMGLRQIVFNGAVQEVLTIEYADSARLHVPVSQTHLLSRYVGVARHQAQLHRLGAKRWNKERLAAEQAIMDLASSLLEVQAQRDLLEGHAFPADTAWQHQFEASFPFQETPDQQTVIGEVKADMLAPKPMDRLVCGDAGYGKTEIAMRAAFRAVIGGKQASLLVPTTVLAQQHYRTFTERMSGYPVRVEMLSRFCSRSQQTQILDGLGDGNVDLVIGTHALLQPGVRFKDLGLVIIDEEQRFGVAHKERFKHIRRLVDVLTMTATPIPRTLYMSMTGARDMSLLQTPPRERMAIQTVVTRNTDKVIREAILREMNREGQVFYLHNRVMTIDLVKQRLARVVPEAKVDIAHGQMASSELAAVMRRFVAGEFDVLLCTTIIESGMDIPRVNTILIDRADRFGIADLYQLRGRVGRSRRQAYAYLLLPSHGQVDTDARKRIGAVKKYSSLSAGFGLALRDLEIRGAGNLLGAQQSGHITAIGFGLYCQLLQRTVSLLKGEAPRPVVDVEVRLDFISLAPDEEDPSRSAVIPYPYIEDERLRITAYRRIAGASSPEEIDAFQTELRDRYGPLPPSVQRLLKIAECRVIAAAHDVRSVETRAGKVMLMRRGDYLMRKRRFPRLTTSTPDEQLKEIGEIIRSFKA